MTAIPAKGAFTEPDFAYPQQVSGNARQMLARASTLEGDSASLLRLRALLELGAAVSSIDADSIYTLPREIAAEAAAANNSAAGRGLLLALEASVLERIYEGNEYTINQIDAPLEPLPEKISLWSRDQFKARTFALLDSAMSIAACSDTPIEVFEDCLEASGLALKYTATAENFIRSIAVANAQTFDDESRADSLIAEGLAQSQPGTYGYFYWLTKRDRANAGALLTDYRANEEAEGARILLLELARQTFVPSLYQGMTSAEEAEEGEADSRGQNALEVIEMLRQSLTQFPEWGDNSALAVRLESLTQPQVQVSVPNILAVDRTIKAKVNYWFADSVKIDIYRLPHNVIRATDIDTTTVALDRSLTLIPERKSGSTSLDLAFPDAGHYLLTTTLNGSRQGNRTVVTVTPLIPFTIGVGNTQYAVTTDSRTGAPLGGVKVFKEFHDFRSGSSHESLLGRTDRKGMLQIELRYESRGWQSLEFESNGFRSNFRDLMRVWHNGESQTRESYMATVMTDRALYHPGDSIEWAAVLASNADGGKVVPNKTLTVYLHDTNYQLVDSASVITDALGRANGTFVIPRGRLTGNYRLSINMGTENVGSSYVTVSDFRLPTIFVEKTNVRLDVPTPGAVTIEGQVRTYSGMPVAGAQIIAQVSRALRSWWYFVPQEELGQITAATGADGTFSLVADSILLAQGTGTLIPDFTARITATTANAETAETTVNFTTGKPLSLQGQFPAMADGCKRTEATIFAFDADGNNSPIDVEWKLYSMSGNEAVLSGTATAGTPFELPLGNLAAGQYKIGFAATDSSLAEPQTDAGLIAVYNTATDDVPDLGPAYFLPQTTASLNGGKTAINIGISKPEATVYVAVRNGVRLMSLKPHTLRRGFHNIEVEIGDLQRNVTAQITVVSVWNGRTASNELKVESAATPKLEIQAESFRNRLTPGNAETWRFRIVRGGESAAGAGIIATMFNGALNALNPYPLPRPITFYYPQSSILLNTLRVKTEVLSAQGERTYGERNVWQWPEWMFMDQFRVPGAMVFSRMYKMSAANYDGAAEYEMADYAVGAAAPTMGEGATEEALAVSDEDAPEETPQRPAAPEVKFRDAEVLQAFFMPRLVADENGNVDITFTVPNANGTWAFNAFAWTAGELRSAGYSAEAVASKPIMVQPNLPRFLRQGDTAMLGATVYNNGDSAATVTTTVELFDPVTDRVLSTHTFVDSIAAQGSTRVYVQCSAPSDAASIGYRVRSVAGNYADGEQTAIPVLESAGTVTESHDFYLNSIGEAEELSIDVHPSTNYTLLYNANPVWTVVKAMRGLWHTPGTSSTSIVGRLYSTLAAAKIAAARPAIAQAYEHMDKRSALSTNDELKELLLDQTPWVCAALSQQESVEELGRIFDSEAVSATLSRETSALTDLQAHNGGFAWGTWSNKPSEWATRTVLMTLGIANSMDMLDRDGELYDAARRAFLWLGLEAVKPNRPDTDMELAFIATMFPDFTPSQDVAALITNTVNNLCRTWRNLDTVDKAYAIIILKNNGKATEAAAAYESLRQFGIVREGQGMCFPSVDDIRGYATIIQAFAAMDAPTATLDAMRQWITVRAQATDDLGAYNPDYVIAALLLSGTDWTSARPQIRIDVDGQPLAVSSNESLTGSVAKRIAPTGNSLTVKIYPTGVTPSYGAVVSVGRRVLSEVSAQPGPDIAIAKRFLVERGGTWVETDTFGLGERVRVQLIIEAGRDMEYVTVTDRRAATLEPVEQLPGYVYGGGLGFYRENGNTATNLFIDWMPAGTYHITYDMTANNAGTFASGTATLQSQYAPELTAHSAGTTVTVKPEAQ